MSTHKPQIGVRVPQDTYEELEHYQEARDLNQSDAIRRILDAGLDVERGDRDVDSNDAGAAQFFNFEWLRTIAGVLTALTAMYGVQFFFTSSPDAVFVFALAVLTFLVNVAGLVGARRGWWDDG